MKCIEWLASYYNNNNMEKKKKKKKTEAVAPLATFHNNK